MFGGTPEGACDVCWIDLVNRPAERLAVRLVYPHPTYGPTPYVLDLCAFHLDMAHDPSNDIRVMP